MPGRHRKVGQEIFAEGQFQIAAPGQLDGVFQRLRQVGEQRGHFLGRLQVLLLGIVAWALRVGQHAALVDAYARLVRLEIVAGEEAHVVAGQYRQREFGGQRERGGIPAFLVVAAAAGKFQVQPVRQQLCQRVELFQRGVAALLQGDAGHFAVASEQGDQAAGGLRAQPRGVDQRPPAVLAVAPCARHQPRQVEIAFVVLAQQGESPRPRVIRRGNPQVAAADRLDPRRAARLVELHQREHVAFVGERHRRHACAHAGLDQRLDADGRVDQRIFAVQVQVGIADSHAGRRGESMQANRRSVQQQD